MRLVKFISVLGIILMTAVILLGFQKANFWQAGAELLGNPWGIVSLVDLYTGFILFSVWIIYREAKALPAFLWVMAILSLGFLAGSAYMLLAAMRSKGNWQLFWMGAKAAQAD